ncbi:hypothetical protein GGH95_002876, partial [Coemansia sp. RSA 1836]
MSELQSPGSADATLQLLRGYTAAATFSLLVAERREYLSSTAMTKIFGSDSARVASLLSISLSPTTGAAVKRYTQMLLRPDVVKQHIQAAGGKLRRFLDSGLPPVLARGGTGLIKQRGVRKAAALLGTVANANILFWTGCAGTGKSHVLQELAARAISTSTNVRLVTIEDCRAWAALDEWMQVSYLASAISLGFAADEGFDAATFHALTVAEMTSPGALALQILHHVDRYCKARADDTGGRPLRVLFCVDGYFENSTMVVDVVRDIAQRSDVFFLALATTNNEYVPRFDKAATPVPPRYSDAEAQVMLDHYMTTVFEDAARTRLTSYSNALDVRRLVLQYTAFHPGDMALLFQRAAGAANTEDFGSRASGFTTDYAGLDSAGGEQTWRGPGSGGLGRTCLQPELSESYYQYAESVFRLFFKLPADQGSGASTGLEQSGAAQQHPEYNAHFQLFSADERGPGSPSELDYVSPRRANFAFDQASRNACLFRAMGRRLGTSGRARYEMSYASMLWMLRREGLAFLSSCGATLDHRIYGAAPKTRQDIQTDISQRFAPGVSTVGYYTSAGSARSGGPMRGLDFVTFRRCDSSAGLALFVLATDCDSYDIDDVTDGYSYGKTLDDSCAGPAMLVAALSSGDRASSGISESRRV